MRRKQIFIATSTILRSSPYSGRTLLGSLLATKRSGGLNELIWVLRFWICQIYTSTGLFHYEEMGPLFGKKARAMYRDNDSLFCAIETGYIYEDLVQLKNVLDLSDYPKDRHLHSKLNKKVPLKLSAEQYIVMEAVFMKPKAYSVKILLKVKQSAKSVSKRMKKTLHHDKFKDVLKSKSPLRKLVTFIASDKHTLNITESNKIDLSAFDDKRYYLSDGVRTYTYRHYKIGQKQKKNIRKEL